MNIALKEWSVVVVAMRQGLHHLLLRKGGIADKAQEFRMEHSRFLLFPTYEHENPSMIQPAYKTLFQNKPDLQPAELTIAGWAEALQCFTVHDAETLNRLSEFHIWSEEYIQMRIDYKPEKPLHLILVRTHIFNKPIKIANLPRYRGCRSWVPLDTKANPDASKPAVPEDQYHVLLKKIIDQIKAPCNKTPHSVV